MKKTIHILIQLPDYLAGSVSKAERTSIAHHLKSCKSCRSEYTVLAKVWAELGRLPDERPGPQLQEQFYSKLETLKAPSEPRVAPEMRLIDRMNNLVERLWPKQPAVQIAIALVCLLVGYVIGFRIDGGNGSNGDVARLRSEVVNMQRLVMVSLLKTESASERIRGANWSERINQPDTDVFSALFESLNYDPVVNVRLAALEALTKYYAEAEVKKGIIGSLLRQTSPLVQLALIQVITTVHDAEGVAALMELLKNKDLNKTVRERVEKRIKEMGS
ncbi:MAG: zf-HC2 domain-containing protein [Ignavibacteriales bacterium]|nr:zf-HC2 domain-containing protein [Ignavibacteriales bacterium]